VIFLAVFGDQVKRKKPSCVLIFLSVPLPSFFRPIPQSAALSFGQIPTDPGLKRRLIPAARSLTFTSLIGSTPSSASRCLQIDHSSRPTCTYSFTPSSENLSLRAICVKRKDRHLRISKAKSSKSCTY